MSTGESSGAITIPSAPLSCHGDSTRSEGDGDGLGTHGDRPHLAYRREPDAHLRLGMDGRLMAES